MALNRKLDAELDALLRQAVVELRATSPELFEEPRPLSEDLIEQLLRDEAELERIWDEMDRERGNVPRCYTGVQEGACAMALDKKANSELADLIQQAAAEIVAANPRIAAEPRPLSDEEYAQVLVDEAEIQRIWDEMARHRGDASIQYTTLDALNEDRGE